MKVYSLLIDSFKFKTLLSCIYFTKAGKYLLCSILLMNFIICKAQDVNNITSELEKLILNYSIGAGPSWKVVSVKVIFSAPTLTIHTITERNNGSWSFQNDKTIKFDVLKAKFDNRLTGQGQALIIESNSGIEVMTKATTHPPYSASQVKQNREIPFSYVVFNPSEVIINRLINAFNLLKSLSEENNAKSVLHIFDDAELSVKKISFIGPDNSNILKANQTGCLKIEINNTNSNNALNVSCVVKERDESELFTYDQHTTIDKIPSNETIVKNIPIKASELVDNNTYLFDVIIYYKGNVIKKDTISVISNNPNVQQRKVNNGSVSRINRTIRMRKTSGNTFLVSCKVNGLPLDFIFDTGASSITLSRKQAIFMLKNGYLSNNDIVGSSSYLLANGEISVGTIIKLKRIDISGLVLNNVEATIINSNTAPLLLGQSALSRLGKIQIDYKNSTLTVIK